MPFTSPVLGVRIQPHRLQHIKISYLLLLPFMIFNCLCSSESLLRFLAPPYRLTGRSLFNTGTFSRLPLFCPLKDQSLKASPSKEWPIPAPIQPTKFRSVHQSKASRLVKAQEKTVNQQFDRRGVGANINRHATRWFSRGTPVSSTNSFAFKLIIHLIIRFFHCINSIYSDSCSYSLSNAS